MVDGRSVSGVLRAVHDHAALVATARYPDDCIKFGVGRPSAFRWRLSGSISYGTVAGLRAARTRLAWLTICGLIKPPLLHVTFKLHGARQPLEQLATQIR